MRGSHKGRVPAATQKLLAALRESVDALPPQQAVVAVACPIFGNGPRPTAPTIPAHMPPALAAAFVRLQAAMDGPPLPPSWPIVNTPLLQAQLDAQKKKQAGRPTTVQPHQIVRLVRFVKLGYSVKQAAEKAGLKSPTACRILAGNHPLAKHPAVVAAGVNLPLEGRPTVSKPSRNREEGAGRADLPEKVQAEPSGASSACTAAIPDPAEIAECEA